MSNHNYGLYLSSTSIYNTIINNTISDNNDTGIYFYNSCRFNTIISNTISSNQNYGIYLKQNSASNQIYHNNFINNQNAYVYGSSINTWDNGPTDGGNYWSDWETNPGYPDTYIVNANNIDHYPFEDPNGWM